MCPEHTCTILIHLCDAHIQKSFSIFSDVSAFGCSDTICFNKRFFLHSSLQKKNFQRQEKSMKLLMLFQFSYRAPFHQDPCFHPPVQLKRQIIKSYYSTCIHSHSIKYWCLNPFIPKLKLLIGVCMTHNTSGSIWHLGNENSRHSHASCRLRGATVDPSRIWSGFLQLRFSMSLTHALHPQEHTVFDSLKAYPLQQLQPPTKKLNLCLWTTQYSTTSSVFHSLYI